MGSITVSSAPLFVLSNHKGLARSHGECHTYRLVFGKLLGFSYGDTTLFLLASKTFALNLIETRIARSVMNRDEKRLSPKQASVGA